MASRVSRIAFVAVIAGLGVLPAAWTDFEVKAPDGRTLLILDNGTWRAVTSASAATPAGALAELQVTRRVETGESCTYTVTLINQLPYEIGSFVPDLAVFRTNGVEYASLSISFTAIKSGDRRQREAHFSGIACSAIARLQVQRGDRCEMGDLNRFSDANGQCLARVRVTPSDLVKFEK